MEFIQAQCCNTPPYAKPWNQYKVASAWEASCKMHQQTCPSHRCSEDSWLLPISSTTNSAMGRWQRWSYKKKLRNKLSHQNGLCFGHRTGRSQDRVCCWQQKLLTVVREQTQPQPKLLSTLAEQGGETWGACQCRAQDDLLGGKLKTGIKLKRRGAVQYWAVGLGCRRQTLCINQA